MPTIEKPCNFRDGGVRPADSALPVSRHRRDIDGLRGIAVLAIVGFHAFPSVIRGGFVGVDIFFVISGYLITSIICNDLEAGQFTFAGFYGRRIRRIFPALLLVLSACLLFGWFTLFPDEYRQLAKQALAGAAFVSNFEQWKEAGYFDTGAETKPLLHLWSLGVEEQFYLVWPALLLILFRLKVNRLAVAAAITAASFFINIVLVARYPTAAFYLPPSRFWELTLGSLIALGLPQEMTLRRGRFGNIHQLAIVGAALIVISIVVMDPAHPYPSFWALLPTCGAFLVLLAGSSAWVNRNIVGNRALVWVGLVSFPLYLWHWAIISFGFILAGRTPGAEVRGCFVAASFGLAWLTTKVIEKPIRFGRRGTIKAILLSAAMIVFAAAALAIVLANGLISRPFMDPASRAFYNALKTSSTFSADCAQFVGISGIPNCEMNSIHPKIILLGDSHAAQLYPGLAKHIGAAAGIVSVGYAAPLTGAELSLEKDHVQSWNHAGARQEGVMRFIGRTKSIKLAIVAAQWDSIANGNFLNADSRARFGRIDVVADGGWQKGQSRAQIVENSLGRTVAALQRMGLRVILLEDPPEIAYNIRNCIPARARFMASGACAPFIRQDFIDRRKTIVDGILTRLAGKYPGLSVFRTKAFFCDGARCSYVKDNVPLYVDSSHISAPASDLLGASLAPVVRQQLGAASRP